MPRQARRNGEIVAFRGKGQSPEVYLNGKLAACRAGALNAGAALLRAEKELAEVKREVEHIWTGLNLRLVAAERNGETQSVKVLKRIKEEMLLVDAPVLKELDHKKARDYAVLFHGLAEELDW
jgi:hypothetical protein